MPPVVEPSHLPEDVGSVCGWEVFGSTQECGCKKKSCAKHLCWGGCDERNAPEPLSPHQHKTQVNTQPTVLCAPLSRLEARSYFPFLPSARPHRPSPSSGQSNTGPSGVSSCGEGWEGGSRGLFSATPISYPLFRALGPMQREVGLFRPVPLLRQKTPMPGMRRALGPSGSDVGEERPSHGRRLWDLQPLRVCVCPLQPLVGMPSPPLPQPEVLWPRPLPAVFKLSLLLKQSCVTRVYVARIKSPCGCRSFWEQNPSQPISTHPHPSPLAADGSCRSVHSAVCLTLRAQLHPVQGGSADPAAGQVCSGHGSDPACRKLELTAWEFFI